MNNINFLKKYWSPLLSGVLTFLTLIIISKTRLSALLITNRLSLNSYTIPLILILSSYSVFLTYKMIFGKNRSKWRKFYWGLLSIVVLVQFVSGILISTSFLGSNGLLIPHPSFILFNLYHNYYFLITIWLLSFILLSKAWCSHLCWFGFWDSYASSGKIAKKSAFPKLFSPIVFIIFLMGSVLLFFFNIPGIIFVSAGFVYFIGSLFIMAFISRKTGRSDHCRHYCALGYLMRLIGYSPFKIVKTSSKSLNPKYCPYDALSDTTKGESVGKSCVLCGDCLEKYNSSDIKMKFLSFSFNAWPLFISLTLSLNAVLISILVI